MKNFIAHFVKYPVAVNIFIIGFLIFGYLGYRQMNSSFFPLADPTLINISVNYPGASPEEVEEGVVEKIERNLKGIQGIDRVTSISNENTGTITVEMVTDFDIDVLLDDVKNAVDRIPSFPVGIEPPVVEKVDPARESIVFVVTGEDIPLHILKETAQDIEDELLRIDGISQIEITGFPEEEIEIAVTEDMLRNYDLTFEEVSRAVANSNILITGGSIKTTKEEYLIRADNKDYYARGLQDIVLKSNTIGGKVYLRDVANIRNTFSETTNQLFLNGERAINISITNTNSEDLIGSADTVKEYIEEFNDSHDNMRLEITTDSSEAIQGRISLLLENAIVGMILVLILLSFFLRPGVAFWVAFGLPISFFGMFIILPYMGITLNMLSMFGMILVIGILVDDGIVIAENIYARSEKGDSPVKAAVMGTMDVLTPILSAIATTILAFSIFFFLDGQIGAFFGDIAVVVSLTLAVSLIEALLILPAHLAHSKDLSDSSKTYKLNEYGDKAMNYMRDKIYSPAFQFSLKHKFLSFAIILFLFLLTIGGFAGGIIKTAFFPTNASDQIRISLNTPQGTAEQVTDSLARYIENAVWEVNNELGDNLEGSAHISNTVRKIGPGSATGSITVNLSPSETREMGSPEISDKIRTKVGSLPQLEKLSFNSGANVGGSPISISLRGDIRENLDNAKEMVYNELRKNPGVKDIVDTSPEGIKEMRLSLKPNAELLGLTLNDVMAQVRNAFFGKEVQRVQRGQDEVKIWVRYARTDRSTVQSINDIQISTSEGRIPLSEIATYTIERGEVAINHTDGIREITVEADIAGKDVNAAAIMANLTGPFAETVQNKYPEIQVSAEGQNRETNKIVGSAVAVIPAAIFLIYVVIVFAFRSYSQPFILLALIPFTIIGVAWGHWLHGFPINVLSFLGIVGLVGIVVNDGLVFTGKFNGYLKEGLPFEEALYETGRSRFRAIFLTSVTTIAGLAPLLLEKSLQAQFLIPMAISIAYGIAIATVLTLFMLPMFLSFSNSVKVRVKQLFTGERPPRESVERAIKEKEVEHETF
ncbi:Multidrug resistance protein MdtC [Flagellimonas maritima]|uniref:Multidrug resistance protein MdtC n=1 Tax=Flagellimonas maritima TaxID=1383885 RepID=A0A2Z4LRI4_9FLAO|nr:efflux RND transporter permease subunit [Allomuricauda aurantiaca]AWX44382.1 Multidrug resistance protein MdtC [Allomuricauda aurantiaca]